MTSHYWRDQFLKQASLEEERVEASVRDLIGKLISRETGAEELPERRHARLEEVLAQAGLEMPARRHQGLYNAIQKASNAEVDFLLNALLSK